MDDSGGVQALPVCEHAGLLGRIQYSSSGKGGMLVVFWGRFVFRQA